MATFLNFFQSIELLYSDESQFANLSEKFESKETVEEIQHRNHAYHRFLKNYKWMEEIFSTVAPELVDEKASEEVEKECDLLEQECNVSFCLDKKLLLPSHISEKEGVVLYPNNLCTSSMRGRRVKTYNRPFLG